jgi:hypothetical protein
MATEKKPAQSWSASGRKNLSAGEKALLAFLIVLAFFIVFFGFSYIKAIIQAPFITQLNQQRLTGEISQVESLFSLQEKDTDKDGLSDFEETYVYETSAYLEDSDSDGYNDKVEIEAGSNPLIAESTPASPGVEPPEELASLSDIASALESVSGQISMDELREILIQSGMSEDALATINDQTLREMYQETLAEIAEMPETTPSLETGEINKQGLEDLTIEEMKEFLMLGGADEQTLNQIDEESLRTLFLQALEEME